MSSSAPLLRRRARRAGMTLMEIMIVIAILGVLMSVLAVGLMGTKTDADRQTTAIQIKKLQEGLMMYSLKHKNRYPSTSEGLAAAAKYFNDEQKVPTDAWGNEYLYFSPGTHGDHPFEIISLGPDGKEGGDGDNADIVSWALEE